jgi:O-antigen ligase
MTITQAEPLAQPARVARRQVRPVVTVALIGVLLAAGAGVFTGPLFDQPSTVKWLLTVLAPGAVLFLVRSHRPVTYLAATCIAIVPFSALAYSAGSEPISILAVIVPISVLVAGAASDHSVGAGVRSGSSWLVALSGFALLALVPAAARGTAPGSWVLQILALAGLAFVIRRACVLDRQAATVLLAVAVGTAAVQGLMAVQEFRTGHVFNVYLGGIAAYGPDYFFAYGGEFRPSGAFSDPNSLGNVLALSLPLALAGATESKHPLLLRLFFAGSGVAIAAGLVLTFSRMSWLGAMAGLVVTIACSPPARWALQIAGIVVAGFVVSATAASMAGPDLAQRFDSILHPTATGVVTADSDLTREQLWRAAQHVWATHPLTGVGFGHLNQLLSASVADSTVYTHAHSTYWQYLAEAGIFGGAVVVAVLIAAAHDIGLRLSELPGDVIVIGAAGSIAAVAVCWTTDYTVRYLPVLLAMALPFLLLVATDRRPVQRRPVTAIA